MDNDMSNDYNITSSGYIITVRAYERASSLIKTMKKSK
jgi:hypothetical protein